MEHDGRSVGYWEPLPLEVNTGLPGKNSSESEVIKADLSVSGFLFET